MADEEFCFAKLNENNYVNWKYKINIMLRCLDLSGYAYGSIKQPNKNEKPAEWRAWNNNSLKAMNFIIDSVESRLHRYLIHCKTAKEVWDELEQRFGEQNEDPVNLWEEFYNFKIIDGVKIAKQLTAFEDIIERLIFAGEKLSEAAVQAKLLSVLPERLSQLRLIWHCLPRTKRTNDGIFSWLIREDDRSSETDSLNDGMKRLGLMESKDQPKQRQKKLSSDKMNLDDQNQQTNCSISNQSGHSARECAKKKLNEKQVIASVSGVFPKTLDNDDDDAWLADTTATMHMTYRKDFFTSYEDLDENLFLKVADNRFLEVIGKGTVTVTERLDGKIYERRMENVLLVPELKKNLFSIIAIIDKNFCFYAWKNHCEVRNSNNILLCRGVKQNRGIFKMLFKVKPRKNVV